MITSNYSDFHILLLNACIFAIFKHHHFLVRSEEGPLEEGDWICKCWKGEKLDVAKLTELMIMG